MKNVYSVYFSPSGSTKKIADYAAEKFCGQVTELNLIENPLVDDKVLHKNDLLLVAMPVFSGRLPQLCVPMLRKLKGDNTPVVAIVVYGNRDYDDALLELSDLLSEQGFCVLGAGAFVAQHSVFPQVAAGRPDANDFSKLEKFVEACVEKLPEFDGKIENLPIKGKRPYKKASTLPLKPNGSVACMNCGLCVEVCPTKAIDIQKTRKTNKSKCITCTACIASCPQQARSLESVAFNVVRKAFIKNYSERKEPKWFV